MIKKTTLNLIVVYQNILNKYINRLLFISSSCRFIPSCSTYTYQAVERYGTIKGLFLGLRRILKCHPLGKGGLDPLKI